MPSKAKSLQTQYQEIVSRLLDDLLRIGNRDELETYLVREGLPSRARMNLSLARAFTDAVGEYLRSHSSDQWRVLMQVLEDWRNLSSSEVPVGSPRIILPCVAVLSLGELACANSDQWQIAVDRLHEAAKDSRWRIREMVAAGFQIMLACNWDRSIDVLKSWLIANNPLVVRAVAAAVAEPVLLTTTERGDSALELQIAALSYFANLPEKSYRTDEVQALKKGLAFTISIAVSAAPDAGFKWLKSTAASNSKDIRWVVRENLKKNRLQKWPDRVLEIENLL